MAKNKKISAGAILLHNNSILVCLPRWGAKHWDLPKGKVDKGESATEAALREVYEETNIDLSVIDFEFIADHGILPYLKDKNLHLFSFSLSTKPKDLRCNSFFQKKGKSIPDMVAYKWISWNERKRFLSPNMNKVLKKIEPIIKQHIKKDE